MEIVTERLPLYVEDRRLPTKWPGDKIRIPVAWRPDPGS